MTSIDTTTDPLGAIKTRVGGHTEGPWEIRGDHDELPAVWHDSEAAFSIGRCADCGVEAVYAPADAELIAAAPKLLAALEAVETLLAEKYKLYAAICGETCVKDIVGVDHEAIADNIVANIRATIAEALA